MVELITGLVVGIMVGIALGTKMCPEPYEHKNFEHFFWKED